MEKITKDGKTFYRSRIFKHDGQKVNLCIPCPVADAIGAKTTEYPSGWLVFVGKSLRFYVNEDWKKKLSTTKNKWDVSERMWQSKVKGEASNNDYVTYAFDEELIADKTDWKAGDDLLFEHVSPRTGIDYIQISFHKRDEDMPKMLYATQEKEIYRVIKNTLLIQGDEDLAKTLEKNQAFVEMKNIESNVDGQVDSVKITVWDGAGSILHEFDSDASEQQLINVQPVEL